MAWIAVGAAVISAAPAIYKGIKGISQSKQANAMHPVDPGFQMNQGTIGNAKTLSDYYGNYTLPGYSRMLDNINNTSQQGFQNGVQGATSGGDVLDLATKMAYGKNQALNQLGVQNAQGKQGAFDASLNANVAAGEQYQQKNAYERDQYNRQVNAKAALTQAGAQNTYGAVDQLAGTAGKALTGVGGSSGGDGITDGMTTQQRSLYNKKYFYDGSPRYDENGNQMPVGPMRGSNAAYE